MYRYRRRPAIEDAALQPAAVLRVGAGARERESKTVNRTDGWRVCVALSVVVCHGRVIQGKGMERPLCKLRQPVRADRQGTRLRKSACPSVASDKVGAQARPWRSGTALTLAQVLERYCSSNGFSGSRDCSGHCSVPRRPAFSKLKTEDEGVSFPYEWRCGIWLPIGPDVRFMEQRTTGLILSQWWLLLGVVWTLH
jgi:hypothetical protein